MQNNANDILNTLVPDEVFELPVQEEDPIPEDVMVSENVTVTEDVTVPEDASIPEDTTVPEDASISEAVTIQKAVLDPPAAEDDDQPLYAGFFVRLAAYLLDSLIVGAGLLLVRIPFWISALISPNNIVVRNFIFEYSVADIVCYALGAAYFILLTYKTGATLGKKAFHIKVVSADADRTPTLFEIIYRETIGRFLSGLILQGGYLMIFVHKENRGLHDWMADTKVIYYHEKIVHVKVPVTKVQVPIRVPVQNNISKNIPMNIANESQSSGHIE